MLLCYCTTHVGDLRNEFGIIEAGLLLPLPEGLRVRLSSWNKEEILALSRGKGTDSAEQTGEEQQEKRREEEEQTEVMISVYRSGFAELLPLLLQDEYLGNACLLVRHWAWENWPAWVFFMDFALQGIRKAASTYDFKENFYFSHFESLLLLEINV